MIQEREFVKMRKLLPKNIRKLNELPRHPLVPVGGGGAALANALVADFAAAIIALAPPAALAAKANPGLEGACNALDPASCFLCFLSPSM